MARFNEMQEEGFKNKTPREAEEIEEMHEEIEDEQTEGFMSKFSRFIRGEPKDMEVLEIPSEDLDEDIKHLLKGLLRWLEQLSPAKKRMFKQSDEFKLYKTVLEKYDLVRK